MQTSVNVNIFTNSLGYKFRPTCASLSMPHPPSIFLQGANCCGAKLLPLTKSTQPAYCVELWQKPYLSSILFTSGKRMFQLTHSFCTAAKNLYNMLFPCRDTEAERHKAVRTDKVSMWLEYVQSTSPICFFSDIETLCT